MFAELFAELAAGRSIAVDQLRRLFDIAITKKLGVVKLPPSFWMQDPKINPRADHLLWAALLLADEERVALAFSALAVEHDERQRHLPPEDREPVGRVLDRYLQQLVNLLPADGQQYQQLEQLLDSVRP